MVGVYLGKWDGTFGLNAVKPVGNVSVPRIDELTLQRREVAAVAPGEAGTVRSASRSKGTMRPAKSSRTMAHTAKSRSPFRRPCGVRPKP